MNAIESVHALTAYTPRTLPEKTTTITTTSLHGEGAKEPVEIKKTAEKLDQGMEKFSLVKEKVLTLKEKLDVRQLAQMERSVREHERSHMVAARDLAISSPNYRLEHGPDGREYAVGGEVNISASTVSGDAQGTIDKALKIERAALAPADPSTKDMQVAAQARAIASKAYRKLSRDQLMEVVHKPNADEQQAQQLPDAVNPYLKQRDFQKNLSTMLDLFT